MSEGCQTEELDTRQTFETIQIKEDLLLNIEERNGYSIMERQSEEETDGSKKPMINIIHSEVEQERFTNLTQSSKSKRRKLATEDSEFSSPNFQDWNHLDFYT